MTCNCNETPLTPAALAAMIDHTFLKAFGLPGDIETLCDEAREYNFAMVAINPAEVKRCVELLAGSPVGIGAAIGFPLGQTTIATKAFETRNAIENGVTEIDTVMNLRALQGGKPEIVQRELANLVAICKPANVTCKVILETCYLTDEQKVQACQIAKQEGVDFVKTSTGFGTGGATVADIKLMRETVGPTLGVKASGGVRTLADALAMIEAGATRIGTSAGVAIVEGLKNQACGSDTNEKPSTNAY